MRSRAGVGVGGSGAPELGRADAVSYVDAGYAVALGDPVRLRGSSLVLRRRRWERALRMSERSGRRRDARPPASGRDRHDHRAEPASSPPTSDDRQGPAVASPPARGADQPPASVVVFVAPGRRLRLPARRGSGQLARLLRHGRPGLRPPGDARHPDLPSGGRRWSRAPSTPPPPGRTSPSAEGAHVVHVVNTGSPPQLFQVRHPGRGRRALHLGHARATSSRTHPGEALGHLHRRSTRAG